MNIRIEKSGSMWCKNGADVGLSVLWLFFAIVRISYHLDLEISAGSV